MRGRGRVLILLALFLLSGPIVAASDVEVLIVRSGNVMYDPDVLADDYFVSDYKDYVEEMDSRLPHNITYDVYQVDSSTDTGPSDAYMDQYDLVLWYTLNNYAGHPNCPSGDDDACSTFFSQDRNNIGDYLSGDGGVDGYGRVLLSGHRIPFDNRGGAGANFLDEYFGTEYKSFENCDWTSTVRTTGDQISTDSNYLVIDQSIEGRTVSDYGYSTNTSNGEGVAEWYYYTDYDLDPDCDYGFAFYGTYDAMIFRDTDTYKSSFLGFGLESVASYDREIANQTLRDTFSYLLGPNAQNVEVEPTYVPSKDREGSSEPKDINVSATCRDPQENGNGIIDAGLTLNSSESASSSIEPARSGVNEYNLGAVGSFGSKDVDLENKSIDVSDHASTLQQTGVNVTAYVQCQDDNNDVGGQGYWGQYEKEHFVVDILPPDTRNEALELQGISSDNNLTGNKTPEISISPLPNAEDVSAFRLACEADQQSDYNSSERDGNWTWTNWQSIGDSQITYSQFNLNTGPGCTAEDGKKTIYMQVKDRAGNLDPASYAVDSIWLDTKAPTYTGVSPANESNAQPSQELFINATDILTSSTDLLGISQDFAFLEGSFGGTFNINTSFDPGWPEPGVNRLQANVSDLVGNMFTRQFQFTIDPYPPAFDISPANITYLTSDTTIDFSVSDNITSVDQASYNADGSDTSFSDSDSITPNGVGWLEGVQGLTLSADDVVGNSNESFYRFYVDDSPPLITDIAPGNESNITADQTLSIDLHDPYGAGIDTAYYSVDDQANETLDYNSTQQIDWNGEGFTSITVWVNDTLGNAASYHYEYFVDDAAPVIDEPTPDRLYINESKDLTINVSDTAPTAGFDQITYTTDGSSNQTVTLGTADQRDETTWHSISKTIDPGWSTEGRHTITIWANDTAGNDAKTERTYILDTTEPDIDLTPQNADQDWLTAYLNASGTLTADAIPQGAGDEDPAPITFRQWEYDTTNTSFSDDVAFTPGFTTDGNQSIVFWINDSAGNLVGYNRTYFYDTTPPTKVGQAIPNETYIPSSERLWFAWEDDPGAGVDRVVYRTDGANTTIGANETFDPGWSESGTADTITLWGIDAVGNARSRFYEYYVDDTPPTTSDNYTDAGSWVNQNQTIELTCGDGPFNDPDLPESCQNTNYRVYNSTGEEINSGDDLSSPVTVDVGCTAGNTCERTLEYWSTDKAGNTETRNEISVLIDKEAPSTAVTSPDEDEIVGGNVSFGVDISDAGIGVDRANFTIRNESAPDTIQKQGTLDLDADVPAYWDTAGIQNNNFTIDIEANDTFGQESQSSTSFEVDNRKPTVRFQEPSRQSYQNDTIDLLFEVRTPSDRPLQNASYYLYNETTGNVFENETRTGLDTVAVDFEETIDPSTIGDGNVSMNITAWDDPDQDDPARSTSTSWFIIDTEPPSVSISGQTNGQTNETWHEGDIGLDYEISDSNLDTDSCQYAWSDASGDDGAVSLTCGDSSFTFDSTNCQDDSDPACRVAVEAEDLAGNRVEDALYFKIDNSPPETAAITDPSRGDWFNSDFDFTYERDDPQGLKNASYRFKSPSGTTSWFTTGQPNTLSTEENVDISDYCNNDEGELICQIQVAAYNNPGTATKDSLNISIDITDPIFDNVIPEDNANFTSQERVDSEFSSSPSAIIQASFSNDAVDNRSVLSGPKKPGITEDVTDTFVFWLVDEAGNTNRTEREYNIDNTAPVFDSVSPANETNISADDDLVVQFSDAFTGVTQARYDIGNGFLTDIESGVAFDPGWETSQTEQISYRLRDYAGNENITTYEYFVDADVPQITSIDPANDTIIAPSDLNVTAFDPSLTINTATFEHDDTTGTVGFTVNESFDPGWNTEGPHWVTIELTDTVGNVETEGYRYTIDDSPPTIQLIDQNRSVLADGDTVAFDVQATDQYAGVDTVEADLINQTDQTPETTLSFSGDDPYTATYTAGNDAVTDLQLDLNVTDAVGFSSQDSTTTILIDNKAPDLQDTTYNISTDTTGERRIFKDSVFEVSSTVTDNATVTAVNATIEAPGGAKENISLTESSGTWTGAYADTDTLGVYTIDRIWMADEVGNIGADTVGDTIRVVQSRIRLTFNDTLEAGSTVETNVTVDINKTFDNNATIYLPPNTPGTAQTEPAFRNVTALDCENCTTTLVDDHITNVTVPFDDNVARTINLTTELATPDDDTDRTFTASAHGFTPTSTATILTPDPEASNILCDSATDCVVEQNEPFEFDVDIANTDTSDHSGTLRDPDVSVSSEGIDTTIEEGDLAIGGSRQVSKEITPTVAGNHTLTVDLEDTTGAYSDTAETDIWVKDTVPPTIDSVQMAAGDDIVNLETNATIEADLLDNIAVNEVNITVEEPTATGSDKENISATLASDTRADGTWSGDFNGTTLEGIYNVTDIYVADNRSNRNYSEQDVSFEVIEFVLDAFTNINPHADINETITIGARLTGNSSEIDSVTANISKPRGVYETRNLSLSEYDDGWVYQTSYRNTSRSGEYNISINASSSVEATNTTAFDVRFGNITHAYMDSDDSFRLPKDSTEPTSWYVSPELGDLVDVNTTLLTGPEITASDTSIREKGNITWEGGAVIDTWDVTTGAVTPPVESWIVFETNQSHPTFGHQQEQLNLSVTLSNTAPEPTVTSKSTKFDQINLGQTMPITAEIDADAPIETVEVTIENETNQYTKTMDRDEPSIFSASFVPNATGEYNYTVSVSDVFGNSTQSEPSSFTATDELQVSVETNKERFNIADTIDMTVTTEDINGRTITDFNTTLELDKDGTIETILPDNETNTGSYSILSDDPPSGDPTVIQYTIEANVTDGKNTGNTSELIDVGNKLTIEWTDPQQQDVTVGQAFDIGFEVTDLSGEPVDAVTYATCGACETNYRFLGVSGDQYLRQDAFVAADTDFFVLAAYARDGLGNSQPVDPNGRSTATNDIDLSGDTGTNESGSEQGTGGGGFGGGSPTLEIQRLQPAASLPSSTTQAQILVSTSMPATCEYASQSFDSSPASTPMTQENGTRHRAMVDVSAGQTYQYFIQCATEDDLSATTSLIFSVQSEEITSYDLIVPNELPSVSQGESISRAIAISNNGTEDIEIDLQAVSECCSAWFGESQNNSLEQISVGAGSELTFDLNYDVPLFVEPGNYSIGLAFRSENRIRERNVDVEIVQSSSMERLDQLEEQADSLAERIEAYRQAGINTSTLQQRHAELQDAISHARTAVENDDRIVFANSIGNAVDDAQSIEGQLRALEFQRYVLENWWKWLLGFILFYIAFFLVTMVAIPYYRVRSDYTNVKNDLETATDARKKAEKQYFRREIDRDTFMEIMTDRQDEILELRSQREELEQKVDTIVREQFTLDNFLKAPFKSIREISRWLEARRKGEEG